MASSMASTTRGRGGGERIWEARRRGGEGVGGVSESEISSMAASDLFVLLLGVRRAARGVSLSEATFSAMILDFDFRFGGGTTVPLSFLGLPRGLFGDANTAGGVSSGG